MPQAVGRSPVLMSRRGGGRSPGLISMGYPLPYVLSHDAFDVTYPYPWTERCLWKHYLPSISFVGGKNYVKFFRSNAFLQQNGYNYGHTVKKLYFSNPTCFFNNFVTELAEIAEFNEFWVEKKNGCWNCGVPRYSQCQISTKC